MDPPKISFVCIAIRAIIVTDVTITVPMLLLLYWCYYYCTNVTFMVLVLLLLYWYYYYCTNVTIIILMLLLLYQCYCIGVTITALMLLMHEVLLSSRLLMCLVYGICTFTLSPRPSSLVFQINYCGR